MSDVFLTRATRQYAKYAGCTAVVMTGQAAGPIDLLVWSAEFRDTFSSQISASSVAGPNAYAGPGTNSVFTVASTTWTATTAVESDEVAHQPLRQTQLKRSYWQFTIAAGPTPLYAEVLDGDIISTSTPNTP